MAINPVAWKAIETRLNNAKHQGVARLINNGRKLRERKDDLESQMRAYCRGAIGDRVDKGADDQQMVEIATRLKVIGEQLDKVEEMLLSYEKRGDFICRRCGREIELDRLEVLDYKTDLCSSCAIIESEANKGKVLQFVR